MLDQIFNLKFLGKQMARQATKVRAGRRSVLRSPPRPPSLRLARATTGLRGVWVFADDSAKHGPRWGRR